MNLKSKKIAIVASPLVELKTTIEKEMPDVVIVGAGKVDKTIIDVHDALPVIEDNKYMFEVNGQLYVPVEDEDRKKISNIGKIAYLMHTVEMYGSNNYHRKRPQVNIIEEYKLILNKQSNLCRNDRDWVVNTFNRKFKKVGE